MFNCHFAALRLVHGDSVMQQCDVLKISTVATASQPAQDALLLEDTWHSGTRSSPSALSWIAPKGGLGPEFLGNWLGMACNPVLKLCRFEFL